MEQHTENPSRTIVLAYSSALKNTGGLLASLIGVWGLLAILGWIRVISYYNAFGVPWLTNETLLQEVAIYTIWPLTALIIGMIISAADIGDNYTEQGRKAIDAVTGASLFIVIVIAFWQNNFAKDYASAVIMYSSSLYLTAVIIGDRIGRLSVILYRGEGLANSRTVWHVTLFIAWYLSNVYNLGAVEGKRDKTPAQTKLDTVILKDGGQERYLITMRGGQIYVAELMIDKNPRVSILEPADIESISKSATKKSSNEIDAEAPQNSNKKPPDT